MKRSKILFSSIFSSFLAIAAFSGVMAAKNTQHVEKAEAAVTNGKYRVNVLTNSANWLQDNVQTVWSPASSNVAMSRNTNFAASSNSNYATVTINSTTYSWTTYEFSSRTGVTKNENYWFGRGSASSNYNWFDSGINFYTQFRSNAWDNTIIISGTWDNFSAQAYGWYNVIELHYGLDNSSVEYQLVNKGVRPTVPSTPSGYTFEGWYKDSSFTNEWTKAESDALVCDRILYAKYTENTKSYTVSIGGASYVAMSEQPAGEYAAQYKVVANVTSGQTISFKEDNTVLNVTPDATNVNNLSTADGKILQTSSSADIYLKKLVNGTWQSYVSGRSASYFLYSSGSYYPLHVNPSNPNEYMGQDIPLTQGSQVKLYATSLYDCYAKDGSSGNWSYSDGTLVANTAGNYNVYYDTSTYGVNPIYFAEPSADDTAAKSFAQSFLNEMNAVCDPNGGEFKKSLSSAWGSLATGFADLSKAAKEILKDASPDSESTAVVSRFAASYDYIYHKYATSQSLTNFASRNVTPAVNSGIINIFSDKTSTNNVIIIVVVVGVAALAVGGYFLLRKKKEN